MLFSERFAARTRGRRTSIIRELTRVANAPGVISLGGGYPSPHTFPMTDITIEAAGRTIRLSGKELARACQYNASEGNPELLECIRAWHQFKSGVPLGNDQICVTNGSQEGLFVMAYLFLDPGDPVVLTEPCYPGALAAFSAFTDNFLAIPQDERGMQSKALKEYLSRRERKGFARPKFLYLNPNCHNPAGVSMDTARRQEIYEVAEAFDLVILEDDPYELLKFEDIERYPTLQSMDVSGRVIRLDSFSKVFVPGFRIGYLSGPKEFVREVQKYKQGANLHTSSFNQAVLASYLTELGPSGLQSWIRRNCELYHRNFVALVEALDRELGTRVFYNKPDGGFFLWLELKENAGPIDTLEMIGTMAESHGVLLIPGSGFSLTGGLANCLRVSYSLQTPEDIQEGIRRLSVMLNEYGRNRASRAGAARADG